MNLEAKEFLSALCPTLPEDERMIVCAFSGDPNVAEKNAWKPRPWRPGDDVNLPYSWNGYITVSSFNIAQDNTWRRRGALYAAGRALMVDDIGTKVDASAVNGLPPSAVVETSPGNFQYWYFLTEPERDALRFDGVIRAFISGKLMGADPGMAGVTRVGRIPGFSNNKKKYDGWVVATRELTDRTYSIEELLEAFKLQIMGRQAPLKKLPTEEAIERNRNFMEIYKFLRQRAMLKREDPDAGGWTEIECPWIDSHTAKANTGAAISEPSEENYFYGGFRCHHGHCAERGWQDLCDWVNELAAEELDAANVGEAEFGNSLKGGE
jgi:hypothetical protein